MATMRGAYGGDMFYSGFAGYPGHPVTPQQTIDDICASGLTTVVVWCIHVAADGALSFNDINVVDADGSYIGDPGWNSMLAAFKGAPSSVTKILLSVGSGGGISDFTNIRNLLSSASGQATLTTAFTTLRKELPAVDGVDFDDEDDLDAGVITQFAQLLASVGFAEITFCPYGASDIWIDALGQIEQTNPGLVTAFNLQTYSGGSGQRPAQWQELVDKAVPGGSVKVYPGLAVSNAQEGCSDDCPPAVTDALRDMAAEAPLPGAWLWMYDYIVVSLGTCCGGYATTASYNQAIVAAIGE